MSIFGPQPERHCFVKGCKNERNRGEATCGKHDPVYVTCCGSAWGMGTTVDEYGEVVSYGCPVTDNPLLFKPDREVCTKGEIAAWEEAKKRVGEGSKG